MTPKVFISYNWTDQNHRDRVRGWADRLTADGIEIVLDQYALPSGHDKYAFMERMVTDQTVTHVMVVSDHAYADKANARAGGVGTESQIISKEIYEKVEQSKFIPIACEFKENGNPWLPVFLESRIWIDFSSPEKVNENWERLVRDLYGKPLYVKPQLGKAPSYIVNDIKTPNNPAVAKFASLKQAFSNGSPGLRGYRSDFINSCFESLNSIRTRERPVVEDEGQKIVDDCGHLVGVRDLIVDWVLLEGEISSGVFNDALINVLERLREEKAMPQNAAAWESAWLEAHKLFMYELFLYLVAALIKVGAFSVLHDIFTTTFYPTADEASRCVKECRFDGFYAHSEKINSVLAPKGQKLYSPAAELIKRQASRVDVTFRDLVQADLLVLMMAFVTKKFWFPQLMYYAGYFPVFPLFAKASQHRHFEKLAMISGISDAHSLRTAIVEGQTLRQTDTWHRFDNGDFTKLMNVDQFDTVS